jgi:Flp pilus assembly protein protease CpaA
VTVDWLLIHKLLMSGVLAAVAVVDLKTGRVPHWLSWPLLATALVVRLWQGDWMGPLFPIALVLVELAPGLWRVALPWSLAGAGVVVGFLVGSADVRFIAVWTTIGYVLWQVRVLGGGDVRVWWALVVLFPEMGMVAALSAGLLVVGLLWLMVLRPGEALSRLQETWRAMQRGEHPSREELREQGRPTTPGLALGALAYIWVLMGR